MRKILSFMMATLFSAGLFASTYTVAGDQAVLGSNWNINDANNEMALVEGVYTLVKENVTLGAGNYEYKVVKDHNWDAMPISNQNLSIAEDGVYDVTFTFDEAVGTSSIAASAQKKGDAVVERHYLVVGQKEIANGQHWNNDAAVNLMTTADEGVTYTLKIDSLTLVQGTSYEFKIVEKGTWTAYYAGAGGGNASFTVTETGLYNIKYVFTVATSQCEVQTTKLEGGDTPQPETTYYLIGSDEAIGGANWDGSKAVALVNGSATVTLAAGACEFKVVPSINGGWDWTQALAFADVDTECSSAGVVEGTSNGNVMVTLAAAGNMTVAIQNGKLCVTGNFVAGGDDPQPEVNYLLIGSDPAIGGESWDGSKAVALVDGKATVTLQAGDCEFKVVPNDWNWDNALGFAQVDAECSSNGISEGSDGNVKVTLAEAGDMTVEVKNGKLCVTGTFVAPEVIADGFYLSGSFNSWKAEAAYKFVRNDGAEVEEYTLTTTLAVDDQIKVVKIENSVWSWFPDGMDNAYVVDAAHAGQKTIYFRPVENTEWADFGGYIFIEENPESGVQNIMSEVKAQKFIENGQLFIRINGEVYTATGIAR